MPKTHLRHPAAPADMNASRELRAPVPSDQTTEKAKASCRVANQRKNCDERPAYR